MGNSLSREKKNNLELYLNDVYEKECVFKIEQEEVEFIQTGIETLVQDLVDQILSHVRIDKEIFNNIDRNDIEMNLVEVYFPVQSDCFLHRYVAENESRIKMVNSTIIKVGSFYDGTRNNFPDEFDFIFPLLGARTYFRYDDHSIYALVYKAIPEYGKSLHYTSMSEKHQVTRTLDFEKFIGRHGPAFKMQFIYRNGLGEQRPIHVDLVPADKIIDSNTQQWLVEDVRENVEPETFRDEILSAGSCLYITSYLAFTETEHHFMKNILSKKHVKVCQILKYLLTGHGDDEKCKFIGNLYNARFTVDLRRTTLYTSYHIKILMIYHHDECTNTDTENIGHCVLQVLKEMSKYKDETHFPRFIGFSSNVFSMLPYLNSTIKILQSMQISKNSYNFKRVNIKSISKQYLDSKIYQINVQNKYTETKRHCVIL